MALFVNETDHHVTIPDGREGALIVPAGCEAVPGPDGALIARPHVAGVVGTDGPVPGDALDAVVDGLIADGSLAEVEVPVAEDAPADDADAPADEAPEATPKRRRGGSAA